MIYTFLIYSLPFVLMLWFFSKVAAFMLGTYVMSYGSEEQQKRVAENPSLGYRIGLVFSLFKDKATPTLATAAPPVSRELQAALDELDRLKIERQILEVRREIEALKSGKAPDSASGAPEEPVTPQLPLVAAAVPVAVAAPAVAAAVPMQVQACVEDEPERVPPEELDSVLVRDPHSGELIVA